MWGALDDPRRGRRGILEFSDRSSVRNVDLELDEEFDHVLLRINRT
jgi:hypothetical protein